MTNTAAATQTTAVTREEGNTAATTTSAAAVSQLPHRLLTEPQMEVFASQFCEVGGNATWMVSSAKYGNGVHQLRDENSDTFWQSDGVLPHVIRVEFLKLTPVHAVGIHLSFSNDESYTPAKISIRTGTHENDIAEVATIEMSQPDGWIMQAITDDSTMTVGNPGSSAALAQYAASCAVDVKAVASSISTATSVVQLGSIALHSPPVYCTVLTVIVSENHQQGRDTHVRGVRVFGPPVTAHRGAMGPGGGLVRKVGDSTMHLR